MVRIRDSSFPAFQSCNVGEILPSTDHRNLESFDLGLQAVPPGIVGIDGVNGGENVNPPRRNADLKDDSEGLEFRFADVGGRRTEDS